MANAVTPPAELYSPPLFKTRDWNDEKVENCMETPNSKEPNQMPKQTFLKERLQLFFNNRRNNPSEETHHYTEIIDDGVLTVNFYHKFYNKDNDHDGNFNHNRIEDLEAVKRVPFPFYSPAVEPDINDRLKKVDGICVENLSFDPKEDELFILRKRKEDGKLSMHPLRLLGAPRAPHTHEKSNNSYRAKTDNDDDPLYRLNALRCLRERLLYDNDVMKHKLHYSRKLLLTYRADPHLPNKAFMKIMNGKLNKLGIPAKKMQRDDEMKMERYRKDKSKALLEFKNRDDTKYFMKLVRYGQGLLIYEDILFTKQKKLYDFVKQQAYLRPPLRVHINNGDVFVMNGNFQKVGYEMKNKTDFYDCIL